MRRSGLLFILLLAPAAGVTDEVTVPDGAAISSVTIVRKNVFDLDDPEENNALYRLFNRLHVVTRERIVRQQLLFAEGDDYDARVVDESARILRSNRYLYDAWIETTVNEEGGVDVTVTTHDLWTLSPDISLSRKGGENKTILGLEEDNLLGLGQQIRLTYTDDVDRTSTSFEFTDRQLGQSWVGLNVIAADNSDGHSNFLSVIRPFHALDARWSAGGWVFDDERRTSFYSLGNEIAEYRHDRSSITAWAGLSAGLQDGWVNRWVAGFVYDDNQYSQVPVPTLPAVIPPDRKLVYPYIGFEVLEDNFETTSNSDQIARAEDFYLGTRIAGTLGWSSESFDADRDALIYTLSAQKGFGSMSDTALLATAAISGRRESGQSANATSTVALRYYLRQSEKRTFFASLDITAGHNMDLDNPVELGGDSGLRGYPLRYQSGDGRALLTIEQRYFTDWYPFRLARVGGAIFLDIGRTFGNDPLGGPNLGWLRDIGFGLRIAPTRLASKKVLHLDIAFPLDGDPTIDDVQISLEAKRSF